MLLHGDFTPGHLFFDDALAFTGMLDFGQFHGGSPAFDFDLALGEGFGGDSDRLQLAWAHEGYGPAPFWDDLPLHRLLYALHNDLGLLNQFVLPPYWVEPNLFTPLMEHGLYQGAFHQLLYAMPSADAPPLPAHLSIRAVDAADADTFAAVYDAVWGGSDAVRVLLGHPRFRCYLAFVDDEPAGLGILHIADGVASMANGLTVPRLRGRGCQTALPRRRLADAAAVEIRKRR